MLGNMLHRVVFNSMLKAICICLGFALLFSVIAWFIKLLPLSTIRHSTKTNCVVVACIFRHLVPVVWSWFDVWLVHWVISIGSGFTTLEGKALFLQGKLTVWLFLEIDFFNENFFETQVVSIDKPWLLQDQFFCTVWCLYVLLQSSPLCSLLLPSKRTVWTVKHYSWQGNITGKRKNTGWQQRTFPLQMLDSPLWTISPAHPNKTKKFNMGECENRKLSLIGLSETSPFLSQTSHFPKAFVQCIITNFVHQSQHWKLVFDSTRHMGESL